MVIKLQKLCSELMFCILQNFIHQRVNLRLFY